MEIFLIVLGPWPSSAIAWHRANLFLASSYIRLAAYLAQMTIFRTK